MAFCAWLWQKTGRKFSLPTEAQWEYACRAGTATPLNYGTVDTNFSRLANLADIRLQDLFPGDTPKWIPAVSSVNDGECVTAGVGRYRPNAWGLCDMHGNAAQWTLTTYQPYPYVEECATTVCRKVSRWSVAVRSTIGRCGLGRRFVWPIPVGSASSTLGSVSSARRAADEAMRPGRSGGIFDPGEVQAISTGKGENMYADFCSATILVGLFALAAIPAHAADQPLKIAVTRAVSTCRWRYDTTGAIRHPHRRRQAAGPTEKKSGNYRFFLTGRQFDTRAEPQRDNQRS